MKLWHDDIRPPPDGTWTWARTNTHAMTLLEMHHVTEASLDHDLGLHNENPYDINADLRIGHGEETGYDLTKWMVRHDRVPDKVVIHSWNPDGAKKMASTLRQISSNVHVIPYTR